MDLSPKNADEIVRILQSAPRNIPIPLPSEGGTMELFGLALTLRFPLSATYSGWSASAVIQFQLTGTWVKIKAGEAFVPFGQFSLLRAEMPTAYCVAGGISPEQCLWALVAADSSFDESRFDQDGFWVAV
jgi:hypothetical protein